MGSCFSTCGADLSPKHLSSCIVRIRHGEEVKPPFHQPPSCIYLVHDTKNKGFSRLSLARLLPVVRW